MTYEPKSHQQQEIEDREAPLWMPPPPVFSPRERVVMLFEQYGFLMAVVLVLVVLGVLYLNADLLLNEPEAVTANAEEQAGRPLPADVVQDDAVRLTVTSDPDAARIYIDGDSVGVTPLMRYGIRPGAYRITLRKDTYPVVDSFLIVDSDASLDFVLANRTAVGSLASADESVTQPAEPRTSEPRTSGPPTTEPEAAAAPSDANEHRSETTEPRGQVAQRRPETEEATREAPAEAASPTVESSIPPERRTDASADVGAEAEAAASEAAASESAEQPSEPPKAFGMVRVTSEPSGALVLVDGERVGETPVTSTGIAAGSHDVEIRMQGYETYATSVDVHAEESSTVDVAMVQETGVLRVLARPWGSIYVDGVLEKSETNVWFTKKLPAGNHKVRVVHPALGKWEQTVTVPADDEKAVVVDFNDKN